jgi:hypothetical protein
MLELLKGGDTSSLNPPKRGVGAGAVGVGALAVVLSLSGCSHLRWPFHRKPAAPPPEVHELDETSEGGASASFPQYWMRNTLVVDLQGASGSGSVVLKPRAGTQWPIRIAFKVTPGSIGELEVRAAQRTVLPVTTAGGTPVMLELAPRIFTMKTLQMTVSWGPNEMPAS